MVDEKKMIRELDGLIKKVPQDDIRYRLLNTIKEYINKQPVITPWVIRFEQRMLVAVRAAGGVK